MKKITLFLPLLVSLLVLSSCLYVPNVSTSDPNVRKEQKTVTFVIDGQTETRTYSDGATISYPEVPKKENYIFDGWYYDEEGESPAYLGSSAASKITLYACYKYDYEEAINSVSSRYIKGTVGIEVMHHKFMSASSNRVSGSGVIFDSDDNYYYILTNNHVVEEITGYTSREYSVIDCYGNKHEATVLATKPSADLAIMSIAKTTPELFVIDFAEQSAEIGEIVIAVGSPGGIDNNVTFGKVTRFEKLGSDAVGYLDFNVIWHDAPVDHGSSGGVLLNSSFEIVGINYAVGTTADGSTFVCGLAVPLSEVLTFVNSSLEK